MGERSLRAALGLAALLLLSIACPACDDDKPITGSGQSCQSDDDCDPGSNCAGGFCTAAPNDAGSPDAGAHDGGSDAGPRDAGSLGDGGTVTLDGGQVDLLDFSFTGDTRTPDCDDASGGPGAYPQAAFESVLASMAALSPQLGFDLGDHMYICSGSLVAAQSEMALYTQALAARWPARLPFFMTMGNHECSQKDCSGKNSTDPNYLAYAASLKTLTGQPLPYYALQVQTRLGRASFLFVADHYFDDTAQDWLKAALKDADANSAYTFVIKHYPVTGSRQGPSAITDLIGKHHFSLVLTAHEHDYAHDTGDMTFGSRSVICGLGGANTSALGFCRVQQQGDGSLVFTQYDAQGNPGDSWGVSARN